MAAEKLTKQRLTHILIMMGVLISAFVWRTFEHNQQVVNCTPENSCEVVLDDQRLTIRWDDDAKQYTSSLTLNLKLKIELIKGKALYVQTEKVIKITPQSEVIELLIVDISSGQGAYITLNR